MRNTAWYVFCTEEANVSNSYSQVRTLKSITGDIFHYNSRWMIRILRLSSRSRSTPPELRFDVVTVHDWTLIQCRQSKIGPLAPPAVPRRYSTDVSTKFRNVDWSLIQCRKPYRLWQLKSTSTSLTSPICGTISSLPIRQVALPQAGVLSGSVSSNYHHMMFYRYSPQSRGYSV